MRLQFADCRFQPMGERLSRRARPFQVVIEGGDFASETLRGVRGVGEEHVFDLLIERTDALDAGELQGAELFAQRRVIALKYWQMFGGGFANLLFERDDRFADEVGQSLGGAR